MTTVQLTNELAAAECLCASATIEAALDQLAATMTTTLQDKKPIILGVMIGALIPLGHLLTRLHFPLEIDYVHVTRYGNATQGGTLEWLVKPRLSLAQREVVVFDDIMDGGLTLAAIMKYCYQVGASKVHTAVMINKIRSREPGVDFEPDFTGINTDNRFLFGFGLDYQGLWRNLPAIYAL